MPVEILWEQLRSKAGSPYFGETVFNSLKEFEEANPVIRGAFGLNDRKKTSDQYPLTPIVEFTALVPIYLFHSIDFFGWIYEYLHAGKGGRQDGLFLTPDSIARLLAEMLQPQQGKIYDPCCGSGGMFVHAIHYAKSHNRCPGNLSF
jgi:type I restriction enzyme M protein